MAIRTDRGPVTVTSFEALADTAPVLLVALDADGACVWCNHTWCELTGTTRADAVGRGWLAALAAEDRAQIESVARQPAPFEMEVVIEGADGARRRMLARAAPQLASNGTFVGHVISATDVTQWREHTRLLQFLAALGDVLAMSLEVEETLCGVAELVVPDLADLCVIAVVGDDGRMRRAPIAQHGNFVDEEFVAPSSVVDPEGGSAIAHVVRTEDTLYRPIVDAPGPDEPWPVPPELDQSDRTRSLICVPLRARSSVVGTLALVSWQRPYTPDDVGLVQEIGYRCAFAVDNAVLYRRSEDARNNLALISNIGEALATTLDLGETLDRVVRGVVPALADEAEVWLAYDDELRFGACAPKDRRGPPTTGRRSRVHSVRDVRSLPTRCCACRSSESTKCTVCSRSRTRLHSGGTVRMTYRSRSKSRAASRSVIERARAFDQERRVAETLQRSLLPEELPDVPKASRSVARYLPGGDVDGRRRLVRRRGARAAPRGGHRRRRGPRRRAAAVMGQLRQRAACVRRARATRPLSVVERLNRFVFEQGPADMATLCFGVLDVDVGTLEYASAGHLPLLVRRSRRDRHEFMAGVPTPLRSVSDPTANTPA